MVLAWSGTTTKLARAITGTSVAREDPYAFDSLEALQVDFWADVAAWEASK